MSSSYRTTTTAPSVHSFSWRRPLSIGITWKFGNKKQKRPTNLLLRNVFHRRIPCSSLRPALKRPSSSFPPHELDDSASSSRPSSPSKLNIDFTMSDESETSAVLLLDEKTSIEHIRVRSLPHPDLYSGSPSPSPSCRRARVISRMQPPALTIKLDADSESEEVVIFPARQRKVRFADERWENPAWSDFMVLHLIQYRDRTPYSYGSLHFSLAELSASTYCIVSRLGEWGLL
ncbi:hypothetical protein B0H17DRAFT_1141881 [Mycena rosella]|uniref:Uncharacterized protein n=1 Tax=Mycena rosella TaxID=1033263 RepID=A0AAD7CYF3_MYCRO|nr:hypothetical protein B0H17DRAFT_1141881 [Mycena rosella]